MLLGLVGSIRDVSPIKFVQNDDPTLTYFITYGKIKFDPWYYFSKTVEVKVIILVVVVNICLTL